MNKKIILGLFFLSTFQAIVCCQTEGRPLTPTQAFEVQRGKVEHFKTLTYRYEVAWEEMDLQSMADLKEGLSELMLAEIHQLEAYGQPKATQDQVKLMNEHLDKIRKIQLKGTDKELGDKAEKVKKTLHDFINILENGLSQQLTGLRENTKQ